MTNLPALTHGHSERLDFDEDYAVLVLLSRKLFRWAIMSNAELGEAPDIEKAAIDAAGLDGALAELDAAAAGSTEVDAALEAWKQEREWA